MRCGKAGQGGAERAHLDSIQLRHALQEALLTSACKRACRMASTGTRHISICMAMVSRRCSTQRL